MSNSRPSDTVATPKSKERPLNSATLAAIEAQEPHHRQPLLFHNATIHTRDSLIGTIAQGDILLGGPTIVGIGPGLIAAAGDDNMLVIDCSGLTVIPAVIDALSTSGVRASRPESTGTLIPGRPADFILVEESGPRAYQSILDDPSSAAAIVLGGEVRTWNGRELGPGNLPSNNLPSNGAPSGGPHSAAPVPAAPDLQGTWVSEDDFLHQHLLPAGRYDETRGGREHAFQGQYWINGNRIDYLDDLGFWAYGEFIDDTLHHAGYIMRRR